MSQLSVSGLTGGYGPVTVLRDIAFEVPEGGVVTILGPNGAGKSTTLRALSGLLHRVSGDARFGSRNLVDLTPESVAKLGIAHVPEGRGTLTDLTVEENLRVGGYLLKGKEVLKERLEICYGYFPVLQERHRQKAGHLSGGEQQMLAISRALMSDPKLMLLDEPSLGLAPNLTRRLFDGLAAINAEQGTAMLIVEQNAALALEFASHAFVLEAGRIVVSGAASEIQDDEALRRAYLGY
jgi:branched-chain amino acid transport system ATP-binding protein